MFRALFLLVIFVGVLSRVSYSGQIVLKHSIWKGHFYTKDGVRHQVGDGRGLKQDMTGVKEAQIEIDKYRSRRSLYICLNLLCCTSLVAMHARDISKGYCERDDTRISLYASGVTTLAGGFFVWLSANSHLKKGISIYNDNLKQQQITAQRLDFMVAPRNDGFRLVVKCDF
jgi:hypothetical protein